MLSFGLFFGPESLLQTTGLSSVYSALNDSIMASESLLAAALWAVIDKDTYFLWYYVTSEFETITLTVGSISRGIFFQSFVEEDEVLERMKQCSKSYRNKGTDYPNERTIVFSRRKHAFSQSLLTFSVIPPCLVSICAGYLFS